MCIADPGMGRRIVTQFTSNAPHGFKRSSREVYEWKKGIFSLIFFGDERLTSLGNLVSHNARPNNVGSVNGRLSVLCSMMVGEAPYS